MGTNSYASTIKSSSAELRHASGHLVPFAEETSEAVPWPDLLT